MAGKICLNSADLAISIYTDFSKTGANLTLPNVLSQSGDSPLIVRKGFIKVHFFSGQKLSQCNPRVIVEKLMHPQRVTVWWGLWAGGIIGPYKNEAGQAVTVNGVRYREMITNFLWPELEDMYVDDMWFHS